MTHIFNDTATGGRRTWPLGVPFLVFVFFLVGQLLSMVPVIEAGLISEDEIEAYPNILYMLFIGFGAPGLVLALWIRFFERRGAASVGLATGLQFMRRFGRGFGLGLGMATVSVLGIWLLGGYGVEGGLGLLTASYGPILLLALGFIVQSSVEEILFRGWMLSRMTARFGLWVGILSNALVFTLMHFEQPEGAESYLADMAIFFTMTMLFSVFLSLLVVRQKSVWGACAWHAAWNWSFITWFGLPTTGIAIELQPLWVDLVTAEVAPSWLTGGDMGPENSAITTAVLALGCLYLAWRLKKEKSA